MPETKKCWNCAGSGILALDEYFVGKCSVCRGSTVLCSHDVKYPCQACIEDLELEWYRHNNEIDHRDYK